jgi:hypothetical protein
MLLCEYLVWGHRVAWMSVVNILLEPVAFKCEDGDNSFHRSIRMKITWRCNS